MALLYWVYSIYTREGEGVYSIYTREGEEGSSLTHYHFTKKFTRCTSKMALLYWVYSIYTRDEEGVYSIYTREGEGEGGSSL